MKKTGIAAMMLSTAIAVSGITVPVCAAPGQTAESAQMQEQPQTETEPAKSISDEDFAKLLDFVKEKWDAGELDNAEDIKAAISEGEKEFGVSLDESTRTTLASALQQLNGIGLNQGKRLPVRSTNPVLLLPQVQVPVRLWIMQFSVIINGKRP